MKRCFTLAVFGLALTLGAFAQTTDTQIRIIDSKVHTLKVAPVGNPYYPAIIALNSEDVLGVNFDYMDYDVHYLRYSVTHCDANWQPSQLQESEYVSGFNQGDITEYAQSEGTFAHYFNYSFNIPNEDFQLSKSGNYLLRVYEQDDPEKVLFQTRFCVCENTVSVLVTATSRTDVDYNNEHQQVAFDVTYRSGTIKDPYTELTAIVTQNSREDNAVVLKQPMMVSGDKVTYDHTPKLIFEAGNEYRRIETSSINNLNMGVQRIQYFEPFYHATLNLDQVRANQSYLYDQTQHGHFTIRNRDCDDSSIGAEYLITHFMLQPDYEYKGGKLYVQGEFTQGLPLNETLMKWEPQSETYTCDLYLKQGAYNYQYLWVPDGATSGHTFKVEGDKYQTNNEYLVKVYDHPVGERYDHFVGYGIAYSGK